MYCEKLIHRTELSWKFIILFAAVCGIVTGLLMDLEMQKYPSIADNSFFNIGICFEFWVYAAMIIICRTKKPLEAACKVFVFFLISQPLVYLMKVPFDKRGWETFVDYKGWFIRTLLTFPGAFIVWYTNRKDNISIAVFMVAVLFLSYEFARHFSTFITKFPFQLLAWLFIIFQLAEYIMSFEGKRRLVFCILTLVSVTLVTALFMVL